MEEGIEVERKSLKKWSKDHFIGVAGVVVGSLIAIIVPLWSTYYVETSDLKVEIISISRDVSEDSGVILSSLDRLSFLSDYTKSNQIARLFGTKEDPLYKKEKLNSEDLKELLKRAISKQSSLTKEIEKDTVLLENLESMNIDVFTISKVNSLNRSLSSSKEVLFDSNNYNSMDLDAKNNYLQGIKAQFLIIYRERLESKQQEYSSLQSRIPMAERAIERIEKELQENNSFFAISAVLSNSGRASSSVKRQALMRVYIGSQNYVDLELQLQDYKDVARISEYGANIVMYKSEEISSLPDEDQKLINTYWGQSVPAILFKEDISGNIIKSNEITFAEGLNEKLVVDRLKSSATRAMHQ